MNQNGDYYAFEGWSIIINKNSEIISKVFNDDINLISSIFTKQQELAKGHLGLIVGGIEPLETPARVLISAYLKNLYSFYTATDLTCRGLYGPARCLMRNIFEFLFIAKYCSLSRDINVIYRWEEGKEVSMQRDIFSKIIYPPLEEFKNLWKTMCVYTHATIYSQQITLQCENNLHDIGANFVFLKVLLECNYHLLNSHLINRTIKWYSDYYGDKEINREIRKSLRGLFKLSKKSMLREPKKVIYNYKLTWKLKEDQIVKGGRWMSMNHLMGKANK